MVRFDCPFPSWADRTTKYRSGQEERLGAPSGPGPAQRPLRRQRQGQGRNLPVGPFSSAPHAALAFTGSFNFITPSLQKFVNFAKIWRPRSRLYRSRFLQVNF